MERGKYKLEVNNGVINITPLAPVYYQIAEDIANQLCHSGSNEWNKVCLIVINALDSNSKSIKSKIVGKTSYGSGFYPPSLESVKNRNFEQAKAYVDGYTDAVNQFKSIFETSENMLIQVLNEILP
jgi:hypothetical protein